MPNPKRKTSKSRRDKRRTHKKLKPVVRSLCPQCHELKRPHFVCLSCGTYKKRQVLSVKEV
ncbi:MAG: 50S ribosomal protein L32 [Nitrospiria bacterium]